MSRSFSHTLRAAAAAFGLTALTVLPATASETILLVQDAAYAPYMSAEGRTATGIWADVINEALTRIEGDYEVSLQAVPWSRAVNMVESGQAHGLVGTYYRPDSRPWIGTYSTAPFSETVSVYCRPGVAQANWTYPDDFKGLTFGNNAGFGTPGKAFFDMVEGGLISLQDAPTTEQNLRKLAGGRIDCYVQEQLAAEAVINAGGLTGIERVLDTSEEPAMIGFRGTWSGDMAESFTTKMDAALTEMGEDGTIDTIIQTAVGG
ncbi:substrate-binding periplasmic protein [Epibacterium ulvae]|uniref:substrate-binding periplasmic protein n=1 Tax=Epibacterium ulvae TaxID=1156985 RepID=UPI002492ECD7|nr:transporter substrate-binding domain-containing protein [Epibacterium ulvae]